MKSLFYKPIKINQDPNQIFIWSDLHYGHDPKWEIPIWKQRGYDSSRDHDQGLIKNWNSKVSENSTVFLLGDSAFGKDAERNLRYLFNVLNFRHLYICFGNHHAGIRQIFESLDDNILQIGQKTIVFCPNYIEAYINSKPVVLSHYAILNFNGSGKGAIHCFGHSHGNLKNSALGKSYLESGIKAIEVCVEDFSSPPSFQEILNIADKKAGLEVDHHSSTTSSPFC